MDPVTAGLLALSSFNQFLMTPPGQKIATDFESAIGGIFNLLHVHLSSNIPGAAKAS